MRRSIYDQLPPALQVKIDNLIRSSGFQDFTDLTDRVNTLLAENGIELAFSRTALYNHSRELKDIIDQIKHSQEAARLMLESYPDDDLSLSRATARLVQDRLFSLMMELQKDLEVDQLSKIAKALSDMAKATIVERKYLDDRIEKLEGKAKTIDGEVKDGKIDFQEAYKRITTEVYGLKPKES